MNSASKYVASLDIGSSKICCIVANKDDNDINQIIGLGIQQSKRSN